MKINSQVLSIPPFISTSWKNINSLLVDQNGSLIIILHSNARILIPSLEKSIINVIFDAHAKHLEQEARENLGKNNLNSFSVPLMKIGGEGIESLNNVMQHNPAQANAPDLPTEILSKLSTIILPTQNILSSGTPSRFKFSSSYLEVVNR